LMSAVADVANSRLAATKPPDKPTATRRFMVSPPWSWQSKRLSFLVSASV
jgi:hypothetical protein